MARVRLHPCPTDRSWLRDSAPTSVQDASGAVKLVSWGFNAWAKYKNYERDAAVGTAIARVTSLPLRTPERRDGTRLILEGGGIETDGLGTMLVTEEWLLSDVQVRNPGLARADYERVFAGELGITKTIWLGEGCAGDDTHGHVDDITRFVAPGTILTMVEPNPQDSNHKPLAENLRRLKAATDQDGRSFTIVEMPMPSPVIFDGRRLPASYGNFYIANGIVLVPVFNDPNDRIALNLLAELFPNREIVPIYSGDLIWGFGAMHCMTQQQPR
jgi:agmatine deiminase